jgi:glyoxalase-like protein
MMSMPLKIDHVVLDAGVFFDEIIASLEGAGFYVSPESNYPGMRNRRMYFQQTYFTVVQRLNNESVESDAKGITILNFKGSNLREVASDMRDRGYEISSPQPHTRSVPLNGATKTARFDILDLPNDPFGGLGACLVDHQTPELLWRPELQWHANGAKDLVEIVIQTATPQLAAEKAANLFSGVTVEPRSKGEAYRVGEGLSFATAAHVRQQAGYELLHDCTPVDNSVVCLRFAGSPPSLGKSMRPAHCPFWIDTTGTG